uniref:PDZ domain-containing protein n=1 Tax=Astatotilapia calliptera TaxID=8154 RepID=A0AAX7TUI0_ASTCA
MADEEETREVLFPDWEGADKTGMTIEQTSGGQLFVKEVKGESPAARSGKVYEGDQIVGATIYFENMSSEETAELLKTLNKHKVGLKLQNKGDKSPYYSPLSTPCRSPCSGFRNDCDTKRQQKHCWQPCYSWVRGCWDNFN